MSKSITPLELEERFTEPPGFRWHSFKRNGRKVRFGSCFPQDSIPDAVVVCLPGLSEFGEKYYELARDLNNSNLAFWVIDWMGQGGSDRYLPNIFKRHSAGFDEDIADLDYLITEYIKHSSVHPDKGRIPLAMLGHSMGGNIGLRYLAHHPNAFECAAFSAPMIGIHNLTSLPKPLIMGAAWILNELAGKSYAPKQMDWHDSVRPASGKDEFSSDPKRGKLHELWQKQNEALRIGGVTNHWLYEALKSCYAVRTDIPKIKQDMLIGIAAEDKIVSNKCTHKAFKNCTNAEMITFDGSQHEIMMETNQIRSAFLDHFKALIHKTIIQKPETLKPF
jgi:lysophospholipase